jgi:hypothetical protein
MGGGDGKKLQATFTKGNLEEDMSPNLDQATYNCSCIIITISATCS